MYKLVTLDNGLRLITAPMPHTRSVSINFYTGAGSRYETAEQAGISHFIEHVFFKGTAKRPTSVDIVTPIEGAGGMLNAATDKEMTIYWCKVAEPHFREAMDVMADIMTGAVFNPAEIEKERQVIIEEINMTLDFPAAWVSLLVDELLWPGHALGRDIAGTRETVSGITRDMMLEYVAERYQPGNTVLSIAGDIDEAEVAELAGSLLQGWKNTQPCSPFFPYSGSGGRAVRIEKRDMEQVQLCLSVPGVGITSPDRFKVDMLNVILGEGMSSRLFVEIRDNLGLAYSIHSFAEHFLDTGAVTVSAGVEAGKMETAITAILRQMAVLKEEITEKELTRARELFKGRILLRMEDSRNVAGWAGGQEILTGRIMSVDDVMGIIESITAAELVETARRYFNGEQARLAVVGPVAADAPLEELLVL